MVAHERRPEMIERDFQAGDLGRALRQAKPTRELAPPANVDTDMARGPPYPFVFSVTDRYTEHIVAVPSRSTEWQMRSGKDDTGMLRFLAIRMAVAVLVAITVSIVAFALLRISTDLPSLLAGDNATPEDIARIAKTYGLDRSLPAQYLDWVGNALAGDLGKSLFTNEPVLGLIVERLSLTVGLAVAALMLAFAVAVPLGVLAAVHANTWVDRAALVMAVAGQAAPGFWLALILIIVFAVDLRWLPVSGSGTWAHLVLPVVTLAISIMPSVMRLTRAGMMEALGSDYVRTARAKGLARRAVHYKHALRNAILPVVSLAAVQLGHLLGGSVIIETVFALNGVGYLAYQSITRVDFPVVQSILVMLSICYIVLTLIADLVNALLDPRIRLT